MLKQLIPAIALLTLAACEPGPAPPSGPPLPPPDADSCGAATHADLVGQDVTALERVLILGQVRVIRPGDTITLDFRPERINFEIDAEDRIARIFCG